MMQKQKTTSRCSNWDAQALIVSYLFVIVVALLAIGVPQLNAKTTQKVHPETPMAEVSAMALKVK